MRGLFRGALLAGSAALLSYAAFSDLLPPDASYRPLPAQPFSVVRAADEAEKPTVMQRQADLLRSRYDLSDQPIAGVMMSGGRKAVQAGITVKLPQGVTWDGIAAMTPDRIRQRRAPVRSISSAAYQVGAWL